MRKVMHYGALTAALLMSGAALAQTSPDWPVPNNRVNADPSAAADAVLRGGGAGNPGINRSEESGAISQPPSLRPGQGGAPQ